MRLEFKSLMRFFAFYIAFISIGEVWIQLFIPQIGKNIFFKLGNWKVEFLNFVLKPNKKKNSKF